MNKDPYKVLGVSPTATDDEIKKAYRELARKYHPDRYTSAPDLAELAEEKMKEVNAAYEQIQNMRANGSYDTGRQGEYSYSGQSSSTSNPMYSQVRSYIGANMLDQADSLLMSVHEGDRGGEWYYLKGFIEYKRGNYSGAKLNFDMACKIDPYNQEYRRARATMYNRADNFGGYTTNDNIGCSPCQICGTIILFDICCGRGC